ncbi:hypothetical protein D3C81_1479710 [compost metagenome]
MQQCLDQRHGADQLFLLRFRQSLEHGDDLFAGSLFQRDQNFAPEVGEVQLRSAAVRRRRHFLDQAVLFETADDAAHVAGIEAEHLAQFSTGQVTARRQLIQNA